MLVLAQRAADQAIEEANETATKTLADARAKSVNLLAEAEQERERLLAKAHKKADAVAEDRARMLNDQVAALSAAKADLEADVSTLTAHLELERDRLRERIESVRAALDDPEGLRLAPTPELLDTPVPHVDLPTSADRPSPFAPVEPETAETPEIDPSTPRPSPRAPTTWSPRRASTTARPPRRASDDGSTAEARRKRSRTCPPMRRSKGPPRSSWAKPTPTSVPTASRWWHPSTSPTRRRRPTTPTPGCSIATPWSTTSCVDTGPPTELFTPDDAAARSP